MNRIAPPPEQFEDVPCLVCAVGDADPFLVAEDDLTGKPGRFRYVRCRRCSLVYQRPRLALAHIKAWYDDEYIAHRKKLDWGFMTRMYERAMDKLDRAKLALVRRYVDLGPGKAVLDGGCGAATFLMKLRDELGVSASGVDFKDLSGRPGLQGIDYRVGLFYEQDFGARRFDLITMWHFLEHDYEPRRTLEHARRLLAPGGRLVIEVPRLDCTTFRLYGDRWPGCQAPQHTALYTRRTLGDLLARADLEPVAYLPWGSFPAYFYLFAGAAFKVLQGRGLNLDRAIVPYFLGQVLLSPARRFERRMNQAMQTVVCRAR